MDYVEKWIYGGTILGLTNFSLQLFKRDYSKNSTSIFLFRLYFIIVFLFVWILNLIVEVPVIIPKG